MELNHLDIKDDPAFYTSEYVAIPLLLTCKLDDAARSSDRRRDIAIALQPPDQDPQKRLPQLHLELLAVKKPDLRRCRPVQVQRCLQGVCLRAGTGCRQLRRDMGDSRLDPAVVTPHLTCARAGACVGSNVLA